MMTHGNTNIWSWILQSSCKKQRITQPLPGKNSAMSRSGKKIYTVLKALLGDSPGSALSDEYENYGEYLCLNGPATDALEGQRRENTEGMPLFGILIVGEKTEKEKLERTHASLAAQTYTRWGLLRSPEDGEWQYIMYMWPGDELSPEALYRYAYEAEEHDLIYCDEDSRGTAERESPIFKTEPDMITQLSWDMLGSGVAVSREVHGAAGGMAGDTGDDRYGYNLRCLKAAASPRHISRVMYTCGEYRQVTDYARQHVVQAAGKETCVMPGEWRGSFRVEASVRRPSVSVIVSNRNDCRSLLRLLMSIDQTAGEYSPDILIADRGSTDSRTLKYYDILRKNGAARVYYGGNKGIPALLNGAAAEANGDAVIFMESTAEVLSYNWAMELLRQAMRRDVGAAGPKIVSPDGRLLHCGTVVGMHGWRGSPCQGAEDSMNSMTKRRLTAAVRRVSALSSICMMVRMETFFNVGCFDESFDTAGFDTEFCLRMAGRGYACVYTPRVLVRSHREVCSIPDADDQDRQRSYDALRETLSRGDPYYSINYDYSSTIPRINPKPEPPIYLNPIFADK